jgi:hypothetical protein
VAATDDVRRAAAALTEQARVLSQVLDDVVHSTGPETWMGPAADRFRWELGEHLGRVAAAQQDLLNAARALSSRAAADEAAASAARP